MYSKERLQRTGLVVITVTTNFLASCGDRGPTNEDFRDALVNNENQYSLEIDSLEKVQQRPFTKDGPQTSESVKSGISKWETLANETEKELQTPIDVFETNKKDVEREEAGFDEYEVHWELFDFGHNLETVKQSEELIVKYARENQLPPDVVAGIIFIESNGFAEGNEKTGIGKMGVMPNGPLFPRRPSADELLNDEVNISWGTSILDIILHSDDPETGGQEDMFRAVALYNAGHVDNLFLPTHGWYYAREVFTHVGMAEDFNDYVERNDIQLED